MSRYTIDNFVNKYKEQDLSQGKFELENPRVLEINLDGSVWTQMGSMVAYNGNIKFRREGILEQGIGNLLKKTISGEGAYLSKAEGKGKVYLASMGKKIIILELKNQAITTNGNNLLAFETSVKYEIKLMRRVASMVAGGLFNISLSGTGLIAITSFYDPIVLEVTPEHPITTDPNATIAWSGDLNPEIKIDASLKTFIGRGSGESLQMLFKGEGFVVIQPVENAN